MLKRWQTVCNTVQYLAGPEFELQTTHTRGTRANRLAIEEVAPFTIPHNTTRKIVNPTHTSFTIPHK